VRAGDAPGMDSITPRRPFNPRRHGVQILLALVIAVAAALPVPSFAGTPAGRPTDGGGQAAGGHESLEGFRVAQRADSRGPVFRGLESISVAVAELRFAELDAAIVARIAAEKAAYEAAAKAAAEKAAAEKAAAEAAAKAAAAAAAKAAAEKAAAAKAAPAYAGTNHMWIPSLGVSRNVSSFACTRSEPPANQVYRWGCAGTNNVYLFGHAWGVMKPLHDAYYSGALKKGMVVVYADGKGRVRTYKVTEWRVVTPDQTSWAIAAQSKASMTLQTCLGARSEKRLLVRLVATG
jgi:sortase (surface protein transpeptidase)